MDSVQFSSVAQSCPTLCDPMNCSTPGLPVHHYIFKSRVYMAIIIQGKELTKMRYKNSLFIVNKDVLLGLFYYIIQIILLVLILVLESQQFDIGV